MKKSARRPYLIITQVRIPEEWVAWSSLHVWFLDFVFSQSFGAFSFLLPCSSPSCVPLVLLISAFIHIRPSCPSNLHAHISSGTCSKLGSAVQGSAVNRSLDNCQLCLDSLICIKKNNLVIYEEVYNFYIVSISPLYLCLRNQEQQQQQKEIKQVFLFV